MATALAALAWWQKASLALDNDDFAAILGMSFNVLVIRP